MISEKRKKKYSRVAAARIFDIQFVFENPTDPHNVAAGIRSIEAMGFQNIHIVSPDPIRISGQVAKGARRWINYTHHRSIESLIAHKNEHNGKLWVTHVPTEANDFHTLSQWYPEPKTSTYFVFGNEHQGISARMKEAADVLYSIPIWGMVESYNLSVSTAITAWHARNAHDKMNTLSDPNLQILQKELLEQWLT